MILSIKWGGAEATDPAPALQLSTLGVLSQNSETLVAQHFSENPK